MSFEAQIRYLTQGWRASSPDRSGYASADRQTALPWLAAGLVSLVLGSYSIWVATVPLKWAPLFVAAALCIFSAMVVGNLRRVLLAFVILDIPFPLDVNLGYRDEAAALGALGGLNLAITTISLVALYGLWFSQLLSKAAPRSHGVRLSIPLALYVAITAVSAVAARDVALASYKIALLAQMLLLYIYIVGTVRTRQDILFVVGMLLIGLLLESLLVIGLTFLERDFSIAGISSSAYASTSYATRRTGGTLGSPNTAGGYLSLLLAPAISMLLIRPGRGATLLAAAASSAGVVALLFTFSRGGWLAFSLSLAILCWVAGRRGWLSLRVPIVVACSAAPLFLLLQGTIASRLFGYDAGSGYSRVTLMNLAFKIIADYPLLGVGANNFAVMIKQYTTPEFAGEWLFTVHNQYLLIWAETGIAGLAAFGLFLAVTVRRAWLCVRRDHRLLSPLALGLIAAIVGHMAHMLVDFFNARSTLQLLCLSAALIAAIRGVDRDGG